MTEAVPADAALLAAAAQGDRAAFDTLASRYLLRLRRAAMRVLDDPAAAEDVAQDALLRAWTRAASYRPEQAAVGTWLHRIAVNAAIDRLRAARPSSEVPEDLADMAPGAELALAGRQRHAMLAEAIASLPARQRTAIALTYGEGWSGQRAADALSVSARALEGLLHRSRKALRAYLEARAHDPAHDDRAPVRLGAAHPWTGPGRLDAHRPRRRPSPAAHQPGRPAAPGRVARWRGRACDRHRWPRPHAVRRPQGARPRLPGAAPHALGALAPAVAAGLYLGGTATEPDRVADLGATIEATFPATVLAALDPRWTSECRDMIHLLEPWRSRLLWFSLGLNLFAAAVIVAPHVWHHHPPGPPGFEMLVDRMARSLPPPDAASFRAAMAGERPGFDVSRTRVEEARAEVARNLAGEPFDPVATRAALQSMQERMRDAAGRFDQALVDTLGKLSPEARTALASNFMRGRR